MKVNEILQNRTSWIPSSGYEKHHPKVSVLLPTWKRAESGLFSRAVQSVLSQTYTDFELIIIDDASTDGTFNLIKEFMTKDSRVSCIRHLNNIGLPAISEYEGYLKARGEFFAFMFDDNEWEVDGLSKLVTYAEKNMVMAVAGQYQYFFGKVDDNLKEKSKWIRFGGSKFKLTKLLSENGFNNGAVLLHRKVIEKVGLFDPHVILTRMCDWDLWRRIAKEFRFDLIDEVIGSESGQGLEDSLGNSLNIFLWGVFERANQSRNIELLPENYGEVDIFGVPFPCSSYFKRCILWAAETYSNKEWFEPQSLYQLFTGIKSLTAEPIKRILLLSADGEWNNLPNYIGFNSIGSTKNIYYYLQTKRITLGTLLLSDVIFFASDRCEKDELIIAEAKRNSINCYDLNKLTEQEMYNIIESVVPVTLLDIDFRFHQHVFAFGNSNLYQSKLKRAIIRITERIPRKIKELFLNA